MTESKLEKSGSLRHFYDCDLCDEETGEIHKCIGWSDFEGEVYVRRGDKLGKIDVREPDIDILEEAGVRIAIKKALYPNFEHLLN